MILNDAMIRGWGLVGGVIPFDPELVNPASIDLRIADEIIYQDDDKRAVVTVDEIVLFHGRSVLASTIEYIALPDNVAGAVYLKSSWARKGLDPALAGWLDPGFRGNLTRELHAPRDVTILPGERVVQLVLYQMVDSAEHPYTGRYLGQKGPTVAR